MNLHALHAQLAKITKQGKAIEAKIKTREAKQYGGLHKSLGLKSVDHLIHALRPYSSPRMRGMMAKASGESTNGAGSPMMTAPPKPRGRPSGSGKSAQASPSKKVGRPAGTRSKNSAASTVSTFSTRKRYSAAVKTAIRKDLQAGGKTFAQLSKQYGPSVFSIKDWKKSWGLTKPRTKKAA